MDLSHQVLRTDVSGMPLEWVGYQDAVRLYHLEQVAYTCGTLLYRVHGGICAKTGRRSFIEVNSIIATLGHNRALSKFRDRYVPPLNNPALFKRDSHVCLYCGETFGYRDLSRDHVTPVIQGGQDIWSNVVTACRRLITTRQGGHRSRRPWSCWRCRLFRHMPSIFTCRAVGCCQTRWSSYARTFRAAVPCTNVSRTITEPSRTKLLPWLIPNHASI